MRNRKTLATLGVVSAGALALTGCRAALPPTNPAVAADFAVTQIATQTHAAFTQTGELVGGNATKEILSTSLLFGTPGPTGPPPLPGEVVLYKKVGATWTPKVVVAQSEGIIGPNEPVITDVNKDGRDDFILSSGWFFSEIAGTTGGSITWWENQGNGNFARHDVITGLKGAYHKAAFVDFDEDGKKDIVTVFEDGGFPAWPFAGPPVAPKVRTEFFKGTGNGTFAAPVKLADVGGSLPVVFDIDADGHLDIATAQYFKVKASPIPPFGITDKSFIWLERTGSAADGLDASDFTEHTIATGLGESFQILPVDNMDGDGKYGAVGVNHTNPALGATAAPQVVRLKPGADIRAPWTVSVISNSFALDDTRAGQAAPGSTSDGDLDGDGDVDLATAGDADFGIYWLERKAGGSWVTHDIAAEYDVPGTNWGQGHTTIDDVNRDGKNEIVFSSYNANGIYIVERVPGTGGRFPASPHIPDSLLRY